MSHIDLNQQKETLLMKLYIMEEILFNLCDIFTKLKYSILKCRNLFCTQMNYQHEPKTEKYINHYIFVWNSFPGSNLLSTKPKIFSLNHKNEIYYHPRIISIIRCSELIHEKLPVSVIILKKMCHNIVLIMPVAQGY